MVDTDKKKGFSFKPFRGIVGDLKRRSPSYLSDWREGFTDRKVISSTFFMFLTSVAPAISFASLLLETTQIAGVPQLGPSEVILSTCLTGLVFSIIGGQPLVVMGVTGPVTILTVAIFLITQAVGVPFLPFYCWTQIWGALFHVLLAIFNLCDFIQLVTRFACETFAMLIGVIYLFTGTKNLATYFGSKTPAAALLSLVLGAGTSLLALSLSRARSWTLFRRWVRVLIADYGATLAVFLFTFLPYILTPVKVLTPHYGNGQGEATISTIVLPPTSTSSGRQWLVNPFADITAGAAFLAIIPALILTILFYFDHNVSSILCQAPEFRLRKGNAYHWDFFVVGLLMFMTGLLGMPPVNGLIPQAPLHTESLCRKKFETDANGLKKEVIVSCHEQRMSALLRSALFGFFWLARNDVFSFLPISVLDGLFLYMACAMIGGNTFYERVVLLITDSEQRAARQLPYLEHVPLRTVHRFTLLQMLMLAIIFTVTRFPWADILFPVFIAILIPLRFKLLPKLFGAASVNSLDAPQMESQAEEENLGARLRGQSYAGIPLSLDRWQQQQQQQEQPEQKKPQQQEHLDEGEREIELRQLTHEMTQFGSADLSPANA